MRRKLNKEKDNCICVIYYCLNITVIVICYISTWTLASTHAITCPGWDEVSDILALMMNRYLPYMKTNENVTDVVPLSLANSTSFFLFSNSYFLWEKVFQYRIGFFFLLMALNNRSVCRHVQLWFGRWRISFTMDV